MCGLAPPDSSISAASRLSRSSARSRRRPWRPETARPAAAPGGSGSARRGCRSLLQRSSETARSRLAGSSGSRPMLRNPARRVVEQAVRRARPGSPSRPCRGQRGRRPRPGAAEQGGGFGKRRSTVTAFRPDRRRPAPSRKSAPGTADAQPSADCAQDEFGIEDRLHPALLPVALSLAVPGCPASIIEPRR